MLRSMHDAGVYDRTFLISFAAIALPALGAILSFLYCMVKPLNRNGLLASFVFLLPAFTLLAVHGHLFSGGDVASPLVGLSGLLRPIQGLEFDLSATGGLWLMHLGALLMLLGRLSRRPPRRSGLR